MSCVKSRRLFIGLWPDGVLGAALERVAASVAVPPGARRVGAADRHLTLVFLGVVPEVARPGIEALLPSFAALSPLGLDELAVWPESRVWVATAREVPMDWRRAVDALRGRVSAVGLRVAADDWRPHVTLARAVDGVVGGARSVSLPGGFARVVLAESLPVPGPVRYVPLAAHPLT